MPCGKELAHQRKDVCLVLPEVKFLGHVVSAEGVKIAVDKFDAVLSWPMPTCVREVQGFLGLANFYRRFMKGFTGIAKPLTTLIKKDKDFTWGHKEEATFKRLKEALISVSVLQVSDEDKLHEVWVDASDYAVSAMLVSQRLKAMAVSRVPVLPPLCGRAKL